MPETDRQITLKIAWLIVNPRAGKNKGTKYGQLAKAQLESWGYVVRYLETTAAAEATDFAKSIGSDCDVVFAVGGDGTVTEVVCGLATLDEHPPLGIIPVGTANVVARELGIPLGGPKAAVDASLNGSIQEFDLAFSNERPFLANVGAGFDADVVHVLHAHRQALPDKKSISMASYLPIGLGALRRHKAANIRVTIDGNELDGTFADVIVCNTANYGGVMSLTPAANPRDGLLDVYLRRRNGRIGILRHLASAVFRWKDQGAVTRLRGREIQIDSDEPASLQVDGDPAGCTPMRIHLGSQKIKILTPNAGGRGDK